MAQNARALIKTILLAVVFTCVVVVAIQLVTQWLTGKNSKIAVIVGVPAGMAMAFAVHSVRRKNS